MANKNVVITEPVSRDCKYYIALDASGVFTATVEYPPDPPARVVTTADLSAPALTAGATFLNALLAAFKTKSGGY